ncbi:hypothetical protein [Pseudomonas cremoricolorata]|uniref:hypothetical protein n=1 Tax=Pseudomonas cremoricolorata TaxID=157783 RepID=UPI000676879C|nr:hypothetical protein [Pseudomonas cremoricolorata]
MNTPETPQSNSLIDPATGMKPGERYQIEQREGAHAFDGFFLDGKYFLEADLLTAVGWLEDQRFIYDRVQASGEPEFAERHAGDISDLSLTLVDGTLLKLTPLDVEVAVKADVERAGEDTAQAPAPAQAAGSPSDEPAEQSTQSESDQASPQQPEQAKSHACPASTTVQVLAAAAAALLVGVAAGVALSRCRR